MEDKNYIYKKLSDGRYIKEVDDKVEHLATAEEDAKLATDIRALLQGPQGESGTSGTSGINGTSGRDGAEGRIGRTGLTGPRGQAGTSGSSGSSGVNGTSGIDGAKGEKGERGLRGEKGQKGDRGDRGFPGASAFVTQPKYAIFYDSTTQQSLDGTYSQAVTLNTTVESNDIHLVNGSKIKVDYTNVYNIEFSFQVSKDNATDRNIDIWLAKNGVPVPESNTKVTVTGNNNTNFVPSWNWMIKLDAGDYVEIMWHGDNTSLKLLAMPAQTNPTRPAVPSCIVTIHQIAYAAPSGGGAGTGGGGGSGASGTSGTSGVNGTSGVDGSSGTSGVDGSSGSSGVNGISGSSGTSGTSALLPFMSISSTPGSTSSLVQNQITVSSVITIPANTFTAPNSFRLVSYFSHTGTTNNFQQAWFITATYSAPGSTFSTTPTGSTQLALGTSAGTRLSVIDRFVHIYSANGSGDGTKTFPAAVASILDTGGSSSGVSTLAINWTQTQYILLTTRNSAVSPTLTSKCEYYTLASYR